MPEAKARGKTAGMAFGVMAVAVPLATVVALVLGAGIMLGGVLSSVAKHVARQVQLAGLDPVGGYTCTFSQPAGDGGTGETVTLTSEQVDAASTIVRIASAQTHGQRGARIGVTAAWMQSRLDPAKTDGVAVGLFQQIPNPETGDDPDFDRGDPAAATIRFFRSLTEIIPDYHDDERDDWEIASILTGGSSDGGAKWVGVVVADALWEGGSVDSLCTTTGVPSGASFDPGNIISDSVMYNTESITVDALDSFLVTKGGACKIDCLADRTWSTPAMPANDYCAAVPAMTEKRSAAVIHAVSVACGINPQVMVVTLQKESRLVTGGGLKTNYDTAWGYACPDTGAGGSASCSDEYSGFFQQAYWSAWQWSKYRVGIPNGDYAYGVGTYFILWNVIESLCGGAKVDIQNVATASLYVYTPYQPNEASINAYPGQGDDCSSYGNRNFFFLFQDFFGPTGGGSPGSVVIDGTSVVLPANGHVDAAVAGRTVVAPNPTVAAGIAAGLAQLGLPYVWGGGGSGGASDGCARARGENNSCQGIVGFDCSGLTQYVLSQAGATIPGNSTSQRGSGTAVEWDAKLPGDIVGFPGHVAVYLGTFDGKPYILEASTYNVPVHVVPITRTDRDSVVYRYWQ